MSESDEFLNVASGDMQLCSAARTVLTRKAWLIMVEGTLTPLEIYNVMRHPAENEAAIDTYLRSRAAPEEAELRKYQAVAYLLQKLAFARADLLEQRRKDFKIPAAL